MINFEHTAQVWGIYGNLGGGKTLTAVSMAYTALQRGYYVVSNVTLNIERIKKFIPWADKLYKHIVIRDEKFNENGDLISAVDYNPFLIPSGSPRGSGGNKRVLVILDECAEWFDQYSNLKAPHIKRVMSWLRHSSKRNQDVVFIVQRREYLNKSFRILVSRWISVEDLNVWRIPVLKIKIPFCGDFCLANVFDKTLTRIQSPSLIRKPYFGMFYDTSECLSSFGGPSFEYIPPERKFPFPYILFFVYIASYIILWLRL